MRLYPEQLDRHLSEALSQSYLLFGNEPLLKHECTQHLIEKAHSLGFDEKSRFTLDKEVNWQSIYECCQSLSLFSSKQIIILSLPETSMNISQTNGLKALAPLLHDDILLIIDGPKLNQKQESSQWFTAFKPSVYLPCNTPSLQQMPKFINNRAKKLGLSFDTTALQMLALWHEGNLLALNQSLAILALIFPNQLLEQSQLEQALSPHNQFTPFQLIDALIEGKANRTIRIVRQQKAQGTELILLLRMVQKTLTQLYQLQEQISADGNIGKAFDSQGIWQQKRSAYVNALQRLSLLSITRLLRDLSKIEIMVKMGSLDQPWDYFTSLCLQISTSTD